MIERFEAGACSLAHAAIAQHSRSFLLASQLLPEAARDPAVVLYAYCRRADDAIDLAPEVELAAELGALREEIDCVYSGRTLTDPIASSFQLLVHARSIPRVYADELLAGLEMDALGTRYESLPQLLRYCYRVAGTVGLMMCHVLGVRDDRALRHAAHLGIAMQLTNICRDVLDDWQLGRLYLPGELLECHGAGELRGALGSAFPTDAAAATAKVMATLLETADAFYASADSGLRYLGVRCAFAIRAARLIYSEIGVALRARGCNPLAGRAVVSDARKQLLTARAAASTLLELTARAWRDHGQPAVLPRACIEDPDTLLDPPPRAGRTRSRVLAPGGLP